MLTVMSYKYSTRLEFNEQFNPTLNGANTNTVDVSATGFAITIESGRTSASATFKIFDNPEPDTFLPATFDGRVDATFTLKTRDQIDTTDGDPNNFGVQSDLSVVEFGGNTVSDYTIDPNATSSTVIFADTESQLADLPVVSLTTTPQTISEADGTSLVMNFEVEGDIPDGGITVNLEGDAARILQQFTVAQTRFDSETGNIFYRFDRPFANGDDTPVADNDFIQGGILDLFAIEDGDPAEDNSDEATAGDAFLSNFSFTITEANASITIPVIDDILQEPDQTFTYTIADGDGYAVDPNANSGTFTVIDGVTPATAPTVGVTTTSPNILFESEQTVATIEFTTVGDIPDGGVVVQLEGAVRSIAEFDINSQNTNPRDPDEIAAIDGVETTGGEVVGSDNVAGSIFFRITEATSTISVPVFEDGIDEGTEEFTFNLLDGEAYEVDSANDSIDITIEDVNPLDDPLTRFRNTNVPTGTYLFAGEDEARGVRENFVPPFLEEGVAFNVSLEEQDGLVRFNRFRNNFISGTYIFASEEESVGIRANFSDTFTEEGTAFYAYGSDAGVGEDVIRFRNVNNNTYIFALGAEAQGIRDNFSSTFIEEGAAFEVV